VPYSGELASMAVFVAVTLGVLAVGDWLLSRLYGNPRRVASRLRGMDPASAASGPGGPAAPEAKAAGFAQSLLPRIGALITPRDGANRGRLKARLTQAGIYGPNAVSILLGVQLLLTMLLPAAAGLLPFAFGLLRGWQAVLLGLTAAGVGVLTPGLWLDYQRNRRRTELHRALPDAIDMLVLCVEAGLSLPAALQRMTAELQVAHPGLAQEMNIIQRESQLGLSVGEALQKFGDRCGLDEVRQLATVVVQAECYGTSSIKALRLHAENCRRQRQQKAEERAQKAAVKIVFPTLLCIFPVIFIVIVGPAAYQIAGLLSKMK
jgi:tight adherence protein C